MSRGPLLTAVAWALPGVLLGCATPPKEPSLLDRELAAYRVDREERRVEDLAGRLAKAKAEADRLEAALARALAENRARNEALADLERERNARPERGASAPPPTPDAAGGAR